MAREAEPYKRKGPITKINKIGDRLKKMVGRPGLEPGILRL